MKTDHTVAVNELRRHYNELTAHKKAIRSIVKAEFEAKIDYEIARRIEAEELKFANHLASVKEREGIPVSIIQDHVLRTRTWSRWERYRDLAGLDPEMVSAESGRAAKLELERLFTWEKNPDAENGYDFVLLKGVNGEPYPMRTGEVYFNESRAYVVAPEKNPERDEFLGALNSYPGGKDALQAHMNALAHAHRSDIGF